MVIRGKKNKIDTSNKSLWYTLDSDFKNLNGDEFEEIIAKLYRKKGYRVYKTPKGPDMGVDLIVRKGKMSIIIQAKNWKNKVDNTAILKTAGARQMHNATYALVVTSSGFTKSATLALRNTPRIKGVGINWLKREFKQNFAVERPPKETSRWDAITSIFKKSKHNQKTKRKL